MPNIIIASANQEQLNVWVDVLSPQYKVTFVDNIEFVFSKIEQVELSDLLVLDADFIDERHQLSTICKSYNKVVVVGKEISQTQQINFIYQGARGYSDIFIEPHLILRVIDSVRNDEIWIKRQFIPEMLKGIVDSQQYVDHKDSDNDEVVEKITNLTKREIEVIKHVYTGEDNACIAGKLNISMRTVKAHLSSIYRKLGVVDRFQLVVFLKNMQIDKISKTEHPADDDSNHE